MFTHEMNNDTMLAIKQAAKKVFLKNGFTRTRLQDIATEAGIGRTALNYYFRSKDNLFAEVMKDIFGEMSARIPDLQGKNMPLREMAKIFISDYIDAALLNPEVDLFLINELRENPQVFEKLNNLMPANLPSYFMDSIRRAVDEGEIKADPRQIMMTLLSICTFPFVGAPMLQAFMNISNEDYTQLLLDRKTHLFAVVDVLFQKR